MLKFLSAFIMVVVFSLFPAVAEADTPHCVSNHEYNRVQVGWTRYHVHRVFDFNGTVISRHGDVEVRQYKMCNPSGYLATQVSYVRIEGYHWLVYDKLRF